MITAMRTLNLFWFARIDLGLIAGRDAQNVRGAWRVERHPCGNDNIFIFGGKSVGDGSAGSADNSQFEPLDFFRDHAMKAPGER